MNQHAKDDRRFWLTTPRCDAPVRLGLLCLALLVIGSTLHPAAAATPPARAWHNFTGNGGTTAAQGRPYVFGGDGYPYSDPELLNDLWYYRVGSGWTKVLPPRRTPVPSGRTFVGWSCGGGQCLAVGGRRYGALKETWIFSESSGAWSSLNCKRNPCPSARWGSTVAYDPIRGQFVAFGGEYGNSGLDDTHIFTLGSWSARSPFTRPSPRRSAAAAYVPAPVNKVVLFGGQEVNQGVRALCDMWAWAGNDWVQISAPGGPCLFGHSMAWETESGQSPRLIVTGGYTDDDPCGTPNTDTWTFTFTSSTSGVWAREPLTCENNATPRPGALMALDIPSQKKVFFGGEENAPGGVVRYNDTVVCQ